MCVFEGAGSFRGNCSWSTSSAADRGTHRSEYVRTRTCPQGRPAPSTRSDRLSRADREGATERSHSHEPKPQAPGENSLETCFERNSTTRTSPARCGRGYCLATVAEVRPTRLQGDLGANHRPERRSCRRPPIAAKCPTE